MKVKKIEEKHKEKVLLTFLKRTREGKYAEIDKDSLSYLRIEEQREPSCEEEYYYSVR